MDDLDGLTGATLGRGRKGPARGEEEIAEQREGKRVLLGKDETRRVASQTDRPTLAVFRFWGGFSICLLYNGTYNSPFVLWRRR